MIDWIRDSECALAIDTRTHPVVIATWHGMATVGLIDRYYRWSDAMVAASMAAEQRLVKIDDLRCGQCPAGLVRKRVYEHASNDLAAEITLANYVVVDDPKIRSVVTSLRWICGGQRESGIIVVDRMGVALELATERLLAERIPVPAGLDPIRYEPPRLASALI